MLTTSDGSYGARHLDLLLVEDDGVNRRVASELLSKQGHHVITAESGEEALEILDQIRFDLMLIERHLPGISGAETIRRIRAVTDPAVANLPVLVVSGVVSQDEIQRCLDAGADAFLGKPYQLAHLLVTIQSTIQRRVGLVSTLQDKAMEVDEALLARHADHLGVASTEPIVDMFISMAPTSLAQAKTCLQQGDIASVAHATHQLKSAASSIGLWRIYAMAAASEAMATKEMSVGLEQSLDQLDQALPQAIVALENAWEKVKLRVPS